MTYKDWRPARLDVESIATDAQLTRIEAKLDRLLAMAVAQESHASDCAVHNAPALPVGECDCGKTLNQHG